MSYLLIDGKRYYKDDRTGKVTLDNVSQAEADRRAQRNKGVGNNRTAANPVNTTRTVRITTGTGFPWKVVIVCTAIALFVGAFCYNRSHISSEEKSINNYMNAQQAQTAVDTVEAECVSSGDVKEEDALEKTEEEAVYLLSDSAERYLEASDIDSYSHDEIQLIINEIYARHGREFQSQDNIDYFSAQDWYKPVSGKSDEEIVSEFNDYERANVELLCKYL